MRDGFIKVAAGTPEIRVADCAYNAKQCIDLIRRGAEQGVKAQQLNINAYAEVGLGLSRQINSRLTVGARVKALLGIGNRCV